MESDQNFIVMEFIDGMDGLSLMVECEERRVTVPFGSVMSVGMALFGQFFYPFEVISLLLIASMVGAVLLAKRSV